MEQDTPILRRRHDTKREELAIIDTQELATVESAQEKERKRQERILKRKRDLEENSSSYACAKWAAKWLDGCFLDPILGFVVPGLGDGVNAILSLPMLYLAAVRIGSLPLTLVILTNLIKDALIGLIPFLGDVVDIFYRMNKRNYRLVVGYIEEDPAIIEEINTRAKWAVVSLLVIAAIVYGLYQMFAGIWSYISCLF